LTTAKPKSNGARDTTYLRPNGRTNPRVAPTHEKQPRCARCARSYNTVRSSKSHADRWALTTHDSSLERRSARGPDESARPSHTRLQAHLQDPLLDTHLTSHAIDHLPNCPAILCTRSRDQDIGRRVWTLATGTPLYAAFSLMELSPGTPLCAAFSLTTPRHTTHERKSTTSARVTTNVTGTRGPLVTTTRGPLAHNDPLHPHTQQRHGRTTQTRPRDTTYAWHDKSKALTRKPRTPRTPKRRGGY